MGTTKTSKRNKINLQFSQLQKKKGHLFCEIFVEFPICFINNLLENQASFPKHRCFYASLENAGQ